MGDKLSQRIFVPQIVWKRLKMLTDAQIRKIKPLEKKKRYSDEKGLYLEVTPAGGKFWRLKYRFNGRESTLTIGSYPEISLAQARRSRDEARIQLYQNIDPNAVKCQRLQRIDESTLFGMEQEIYYDKSRHRRTLQQYIEKNADLNRLISNAVQNLLRNFAISA